MESKCCVCNCAMELFLEEAHKTIYRCPMNCHWMIRNHSGTLEEEFPITVEYDNRFYHLDVRNISEYVSQTNRKLSAIIYLQGLEVRRYDHLISTGITKLPLY